jgi:antitoxin VapB
LDREEAAVPIRRRLQAYWDSNRMPPATGLKADKAFFDDLSGDAE